MKKIILALFIAFISTLTYAQESQTGYNYLRLPVSAHAAALGGENITIIEDDASLTFSNPALAASVSDKTIGLNYMNYMEGANYASASFTKIVKEKATIAGGIQYMNYGKMKRTDENDIQDGEFSASDIAISGTFAYQLSERIVGGITAKMALSYIGDYSSMAMGVDLGINYYDPDREWSLSAVVKNLGGEIKAYDEEYNKMPIDLQIGASKTFAALPVRVSATLVDMTHYDYSFRNHICLGADILFSESIWAGAGYNFRRNDEMKIQDFEDESSHGSGLTLGAGVNLDRFKINVAYGKFHVSASSIIINAAFSL